MHLCTCFDPEFDGDPINYVELHMQFLRMTRPLPFGTLVGIAASGFTHRHRCDQETY